MSGEGPLDDIINELENFQEETQERREESSSTADDTASSRSSRPRRSGSPPPESTLPEITAEELLRRPHSYRGFSPQLIDAVIDTENKTEARRVLQFIEDGRWDDMLADLHTAYVPLDPDEREMFWKRNPGLLSWVGAWARANDLIDTRGDRPAGVENPHPVDPRDDG